LGDLYASVGETAPEFVNGCYGDDFRLKCVNGILTEL
jgi:hypothetical protein